LFYRALRTILYRKWKKKIVPLNIGELLTPIGLAYWIADEGCFCKSSQRVILCTESFTLKEVNLRPAGPRSLGPSFLFIPEGKIKNNSQKIENY
jgi:hypothetical protein